MSRIIFLFSILAFFVTLPTPSAIADTAGANELMILYSNNVNGETEPCG